ncbi:hypothetical protein D3C81_1487990 [compost metagenome]
MTTQCIGSSATQTGTCSCSESSSSSPLSSAPPPVRTTPRSIISADSSGGVRSSTDLAAATIIETGSHSASFTSPDEIVSVWGSPLTMSRPLMSISAFMPPGRTEPIETLISSAVRSPISSLYFCLIYFKMASSNLSPATLIEEAVTTSPMDRTATSVVPPPISTTIFPLG